MNAFLWLAAGVGFAVGVVIGLAIVVGIVVVCLWALEAEDRFPR